MSDPIKSYKLSPHLKAELGLSRKQKFSLPSFSIKLPKLPWKSLLVTAGVFLFVTGAYLGVKKTFEYVGRKTEAEKIAQEQEYKNHLASIRQEVVSKPLDAVGFVTLSQEYLKNGDAERAQAAAEIAPEKDPAWRDAYLNLGQVYLALNQFEKARVALETSLEKDPLCGQAHYLLSLAYQELNKDDLAKQEFAKAKKFGFETEIGG